MSNEEKSWFAAQYARLSTGLKMLLILSLGLFPLGLIAILASVESARDNSEKRAEETKAALEISAQRINSAIERTAITIRAANAAVSFTPPDSDVCKTTLRRLASGRSTEGHYALYGGDGRVRCATEGYAPPPALPHTGHKSILQISPDGAALRFALFDGAGRIEGSGEFRRETLARFTGTQGLGRDIDLDLLHGDRVMRLREGYEEGALLRNVVMTEPVAAGRLQLRITAGTVPIRPAELLMILLPVMMWVLAAFIGWLIVDRLLLKPLVRMQQAVTAYKPGDRHLDLPALATPAREIGELGAAFNQVTQTVARHEDELEAAIERQTRLVREVHHRVKNNLQVVASLLNLHARGSANEEVAAAYASIQRRVDALAVVHRNHYAELEENRGVALRPLVSELSANLRATAPASASHMQIRLDIEPFYVTQDVAVSVAFLLTEMVEFAMFCGAQAVAILLAGTGPKTARLTVESESLQGEIVCDPQLFERFDRIITGLSRQLRSSIDRDREVGRYAIEIAVVELAEL